MNSESLEPESQSPKEQVNIKDNPLIEWKGLPQFDKIKVEHVKPAVQHGLAEASSLLQSIEQSIAATWEDSFQKLEQVDLIIERVWGPVSHLVGVATSDELREVHKEMQAELVEFSMRYAQSKPIYETAVAIKNGVEWDKLNAAKQRIIDKAILNAELSGIALEQEKQEQFNALQKELSELRTQFSNNILDATKAVELILTDPEDVAGIPDVDLEAAANSYNKSAAADDGEERSAATKEAGPWRFSLDLPSLQAYLKHGPNRQVRETLYRAHVTRASSGEFDNTDIIEQVISKRQQQAELLGKTSYAEVSLAKKMAPDVQAVQAMFDQLLEVSQVRAANELEELRAFAKAQGADYELMNWDLTYWVERMSEERFTFTEEELLDYFPITQVLEGMFELTSKLFDVRIEESQTSTWHEDVSFYKVFNSEDEHIASFYLDPFARPENKRSGAWMNNALGRKIIDGTIQNPVAYLTCNGKPPTDAVPGLMTFREVETLFHEFGHGLQHMLTTIDEADAAGLANIEWDAVEIASQFMENWCYHRPTVDAISGHYQTGEKLPDDLFKKLVEKKKFRAASQLIRQLGFGMTDIKLYTEYAKAPNGNAVKVMHDVVSAISPIAPVPEDKFLCSFSHIISGGYAVGYYSYKWSEVLSADCFEAFEEAGLDNPAAVAATGRRFRDSFLALGGSIHPMEVFKSFRGREPSVNALLRHEGLDIAG